ncbi:glycosyltransferase involved in cell wall biosynthesis [Fontibacillus phaseoli]|uniref:Glycosyltransferase involved in cell wall biosynthesis n=1 Tax=Fontibacillus phaseoli TaxID=1416533 RepID=A0A369BJA7_9BACL|nr:glycosyltransferase family 4 protein [Fontibacillus phaseoli]RCX19774.1 glycosyltransferase involved in cell wall biosynthesis [Fontibacillus phaseoli]
MSEGKKLMLFSHVCNTRSITGAEKLLLFLARKLSLHFTCTIVAPQEGKLTKLAQESGIQTILLETPMLYIMCAPNENLSREAQRLKSDPATACVVQLLERERPDYVFVNTSVNVIPAMAAKSLGIPVIWHITEIIRDNPHTASAVAIIDRYSDWIVGISETAVAPFRENPVEYKVSLLYPSWGADDFRPALWSDLRNSKRKEWGIKADAKVIGYISSFLIVEKGADHFIESVAKLGKLNPGLRFVVIGGEVDRVYYQSLKRRVIDSGRSSQFIFIDYEEDIEGAYCAMDIVVIPSLLSEGFGMTAMEAMIFGKPVVAYASGGLREILQFTGNEQYLVPTGDKEGLTAKISELLVSPETSDHVGLENQRRVEAMFGSEAYETRLLSILGHIFSLSGNPVPMEEMLYTPPIDIVPVPDDQQSPQGAPILGRRRRRRKLRRRASLRKRSRVISARKRTGRKIKRKSRRIARGRKRVRRSASRRR